MDYQCTQPSEIEMCRQAEEMERQREIEKRNRVHEETMQMLQEMIKTLEEKRIFEEAARQEEKRIAKEKEAAELEAKRKIQECLNIEEKSIPQASTRSRKFRFDQTLKSNTQYIHGKPNSSRYGNLFRMDQHRHPIIISLILLSLILCVPAPRKKLDSEPQKRENKYEMADTQLKSILSQGSYPDHIFNQPNQTSTARGDLDNVEMAHGKVQLVNDIRLRQLTIPTSSDNTKIVNNPVRLSWVSTTNNQLRLSSTKDSCYVHDGHIVTEPVQRKAPSQSEDAPRRTFRPPMQNLRLMTMNDSILSIFLTPKSKMFPTEKPKKATADLHKDILGTRNPGLGYMAKRAQPVLYDADTLFHPTHHPKELSGDQAYWLSANEIASQASKSATPGTPFVRKSRPPSQVLASRTSKNKLVFPHLKNKISPLLVLTFRILFVPPYSEHAFAEDHRSACDREHTKVLELEAEISK
ncbi:hypothetical protein Tco_1490550 [Tanacetum coccineum]